MILHLLNSTYLIRGLQSISRRADVYLLLLFGLSLLALTPLAAPGYFYEAHDGRHSVFYLVMFDASLRDGELWPRWAMHHNQGYGYPTFMIQAPLGFYLAEVFVFLGAGFTTAVKLTWATSFLVSAWGMYVLVRHWLGEHVWIAPAQDRQRWEPARLAGVVAGLVYVFIPYHLVDIYVRAALNDALLFAWFPWVLLAFDLLATEGYSSGWQQRLALAAIMLAGTLLTHTFALISFTPLLAAFILFRLAVIWREQAGVNGRFARMMVQRTVLAAAAGAGALLLCAGFFVPLFTEASQYLQQQVYISNTYDFRRHFVHFGQYFSPIWGFGYSDDPVGADDGMSFQLGVVALLLAIVAGAIAWRPLRSRATMGFLLAATVILLAMMSPITQPLWEAVPMLAVVQFPWRLLSLVALTMSALAGLVVWQLAMVDRTDMGGPAVVALLVGLASFPYVQAQLQPIEPWREDGRAVFQFERQHPDMFGYTAWVAEQFHESPLSSNYAAEDYEEDGDNEMLERLAIIQGDGSVLSQYSRGSSFGGVVQIETPAVVRIHTYFFPGWQVTVDDVPVSHRVSGPHGLVEVDVPVGQHRIDMRMGATPPRRLGAIISWTTLLALCTLAGWSVWSKRKLHPIAQVEQGL